MKSLHCGKEVTRVVYLCATLNDDQFNQVPWTIATQSPYGLDDFQRVSDHHSNWRVHCRQDGRRFDTLLLGRVHL